MSSIRDKSAEVFCGTFGFVVPREIRSECEPSPSGCMRRTVEHSMPFGVKYALSSVCETHQTTTAESFARESRNVSTEHVMCVDSRIIFNSSEGTHECAHCIDASVFFLQKSGFSRFPRSRRIVRNT